jgi:hypothetical protein
MFRGAALLVAPIVRDLVKLPAGFRERLALTRANLRHPDRRFLVFNKMTHRHGQG